MAQQLLTESAEHPNWKKAFTGLSIFVLVIMPVLSHCYGQSGDEWLQIIYGKDIYNYFFNGNPQALDYTNMGTQYSGLEYYGGLYDFSMDALHHILPAIPLLILRHFFNSILGALMMVFTGLLAYRFSRKWMVGTLALLFIFFSPRLFGESMNNPKDIPFAAGFIIGMYYLVALLQDLPARKWKYAIGMGIGLIFTYGVRPAGGMLQVVYWGMFTVVYYLLHKDFKTLLNNDNRKLLKQLVLMLIVAVGIGYIIGMLCWPWGLQSPISHPFEALKGMTNRDISIRVLFDGAFYRSNSLPPYYEFKWISITTPSIILLGVVLFIPLALLTPKKQGWFPIIFLLFCAFFPLLYMIYKKSTLYDTWRHVFFVYPFWVIMSALAFDMATHYIKNIKLYWLPYAVAIVGLLPAIFWTITSHPNQYVYFNELQGGVKGAFGNYDLDYYQNTNKQTADWILKNVKPIPGRKVMVLSNMLGYDRFFANDTSWLTSGYARYGERSTKDWDYYIDYPRFISAEELQNDRWPPQNAVYTVTVHGVPLSTILINKSPDAKLAYDAMQKKDFATAADKYASYIKTDTTDDFVYINYAIVLANTGKIDQAIAAASAASRIDPGSIQYYQVLAQLYHSKGDDASAQRAMATAQALVAREEELAGDQQQEQ